MKNLIICSVALFTISYAAFAEEKVLINSCAVNFKYLKNSSRQLEMKIETFKNGDSYSSTVTNKENGSSTFNDEITTVEEMNIRAGLNENSKADDLNDGEKIIVHAMHLTGDSGIGHLLLLDGDSDIKEHFNTGLDLTEVRYVKLLTVGKKSKFGSATIVEAKNEAGENLGSFLGGFLVRPCQK